MNNIYLLYCTILCAVFMCINLKKIGLHNKTYILPSTIFSFMWGITSLGGFLFSNNIIETNEFYVHARNLETIGDYQFLILSTAFIAFILVHIKYKKTSIVIPFEFVYKEVPFVKSRLKWFLYAYFFVGMIRMLIVVTTVGFDYVVMRNTYIESRATFSSFDQNLIRVASYLSVFAQFYICLLAIECATKGINYKKLFYNFILFCPFQMSFGGRLFILSFFMPFFFSYFLTYFSLSSSIAFRKREKIKIKLIILIPLLGIIFFQMLKMGANINWDTFRDFSTELFYTSSIYIHLNEFWTYLPNHFEIEYGQNIIGYGTDIYQKIKEAWEASNNSARFCVPSMIPQMYLDFGKYGSLFFYFVFFYNIEKYAILNLKSTNIKGFLIFILLCLISYQTAASAMSDLLKTLIVGYIVILIIVKTLNKKAYNI